MTCLHCGADTSNGLTLCSLCQVFVARVLDVLPVYFRNLARWERGRGGMRQVPGSRVLWDGDQQDGDRIGRALDEASNALVTWARTLVEARPYLAKLLDRLAAADVTEAETVAWLCAGFRKYLTSMATLDWCGEFVREMDHHERRLQALTTSAVPGWYAGACRLCQTPTYVVPGLTWVTCSELVTVTDDDGRRTTKDIGCGATTYARDHLDVVLAEASEWRAPPRRLAEALVALLDNEPSVPRLYERIKKWSQRGRILPIDRLGYHRDLNYAGERYTQKHYRLDDVLALLRSEGQTRVKDGAA